MSRNYNPPPLSSARRQRDSFTVTLPSIPGGILNTQSKQAKYSGDKEHTTHGKRFLAELFFSIFNIYRSVALTCCGHSLTRLCSQPTSSEQTPMLAGKIYRGI
jgi:hypothetical protein